ncbi:hypothetical protein [Ralstonia pseudosolanacearum]|uniref:hypothetical protein n=1 Tax=Ralstonia pseudosolanacearum TaxID=1310165 RepID=UPI0018D015FB|nr:hypothetical protein [Ralstonia pseudosolanacearum]
MKRLPIGVLATLLAFPPSWAHAEVPLPSITSKGRGAVAVNSNSGNIYTTQQETVNNTSTIVHYGPRTTEQEKFAQTQRVLLQIQNPTKLEVTAAEWRNWLGEDEPYLTLTIKSTTHMPAAWVKLSVLDPTTGKTYQSLKPYRKLKVSRTMRAIGDAVSLEGTKSYDQPLIALSDAYQLHPDLRRANPNACIFGATLDVHDVFVQRTGPGSTSTRTLPFLIRVAFEDAFGRKLEQTSFVFAKALQDWSGEALHTREGARLPDVCQIPPTITTSSSGAGVETTD